MSRFIFSATGFKGMSPTTGIENLSPRVNKSELCRPYFIENGRVTPDGGISNRLGFEKVATLASSKVNTLELMPAYDVMFGKCGTSIYVGTKAQWKADTQWDTGVTRTAARRDFFFPKGKDMFATNITDSYLRIACSTISAAIAASDSTITIRTGDISQFASGGGTVVINGTSYTYTGTNTGANTLTGVQEGGGAVTTTQSSGVLVIEATEPANAPKATCIAELQGQALTGGESSTNPAAIKYGDISTLANPELFYAFTGGSSGSKLLQSDTTALKGSGIELNNNEIVFVGMKKGLAIATGFTSGALITRVFNVTHGVPNAFCVAQMDKDLAVVTNQGRILRIGVGVNGYGVIEDPKKPATAMDYAIQRYVRENRDEDQSLAFCYANPDRKELIASIIINGLSQEFVYQWDANAWSVDTTKNHACKVYFEGETFAGADDTSGKVYLDNDGKLDDGLNIVLRITTGKFNLRAVTGDWLNLVHGGLLNEVGEYLLSILINDSHISGSPFRITAEDLVEKGIMNITNDLIPIGAGQFGANAIGSTGSTASGYKYDLSFEFADEGETCQIIWETQEDATEFELRYFNLEGEHEGKLLKNSI